jgi:murein DD-endopeptidase MepM/ murein hydrolase activator NlpD
MARKPVAKRAIRLSRPDTERFFTLMLVFSHRTFRWSLARRTILWIAASVLVLWFLAMTGSAYGLWATKKIMSFSNLQRETYGQQEQIRQSLERAESLYSEVQDLSRQLSDLKRAIDPRAPGAEVLPRQGLGPAQGDSRKLGSLRQELEATGEAARLIRASMEPIIARWNTTPSIPPTAGYLSSGFGIRINPFSRNNEAGEGLLSRHSGFDITNAEGTPIQATADGTVENAGWMDRYGNGVVIRHRPGVETLYGHMSRLNVKPGQKVTRGDIVGFMGHTGAATGVHLHYEVHLNGTAVNPQPYMRLQRQWLSSLR